MGTKLIINGGIKKYFVGYEFFYYLIEGIIFILLCCFFYFLVMSIIYFYKYSKEKQNQKNKIKKLKDEYLRNIVNLSGKVFIKRYINLLEKIYINEYNNIKQLLIETKHSTETIENIIEIIYKEKKDDKMIEKTEKNIKNNIKHLTNNQ